MTVCIIPARGGSKRIHRKNIRNFCGKPMVAHAIKTAIDTLIFDRIIVSTDDPEIADIARSFGAEIPELRPATLSDDHSTTIQVIQYVISSHLFNLPDATKICCLYPCTPLLKAAVLVDCMHECERVGKGFVMPVLGFNTTPFRALLKQPNNRLVPAFQGNSLKRTQDFEQAYYDAGQFYIASKETWVANSDIHSAAYGYELNRLDAVDVDTEEDWALAEAIYQLLQKKNAVTGF